MVSRVPDDPDLFFTEFFPVEYEAYPAFPRETTPGSAAFEVTGIGAWSLRVRDRRLEIERGVAPDCVFRLETSKTDFAGLFVSHARAAIEKKGELSNDLRHAFLPLFINERKKAVAASAKGALLLLLKDGARDHRLTITPGISETAEARASVRLSLPDFLGLAGGRKKVTLLLATGKVSVRGDMAHALKLSGLLS